MEITIGTGATRQDYRRAFGLHHRPPTMVRLAGEALVVVLGVGLVFSTFRLASWDGLAWQWLLLVAMIGFLATLPFWYPRTLADAQYKLEQHTTALERMTVSPEGFELAGQGVQMQLRWQAYASYRRAEGIVLLYNRDDTFTFFPRSVFGSDGHWQTFIGWAEEKLPESRSTRLRLSRNAIPLWATSSFALAVALAVYLLILPR